MKDLKDSGTNQMLVLFIGRAASFVFTFFIPIVLVRIFSVEEFGHYKQIFLIAGSLMVVMRFGMEPSLYYFIPKNTERKNIYLSQTMLFYAFMASILFVISLMFRDKISIFLNNPKLISDIPMVTVYAVFMVSSMPMEATLISLKKTHQASAVIFATELLKAVCMIGTALLFGTIRSMIIALSVVAIGRIVVFIVYAHFRLNFSFNRPELEPLKTQFSYAMPLYLAALLLTFSETIHYYMVSYLYNVSSFAVYSVGFMQLPLISIFISSIQDVSMVAIAEFEKQTHTEQIAFVIFDSIKKLAVIFFPLFGFLVLNAREFIIALYTDKFYDSIPIFAVSLASLPLTVFNLNYVLRSLGKTKFLFITYVTQLLATIVLLYIGHKLLGLLGTAIGVISSMFLGNFMILLKVKKELHTGFSSIVPLSNIVKITSYTFLSLVVVFLLKLSLHLSEIEIFIISFFAFAILYLLCIYRSRIVSDEMQIFFDLSKKLFRISSN